MPSLPLELERLIFETAAFQVTNHDSRLLLTLVAKRVYEWIRPILYRVAITEVPTKGRTTIRNWRTAQITDVAPFTRHLLITYLVGSTSHVIELLSTFRNVENLAIWLKSAIDPKVLERMNDLPLRVLSFAPADIKLVDAIKYCPALRNVTHLEITSLNGSTWNDFKVLAEFPNLTHLCLEVQVDDGVVQDLLRYCPSLRAMVYQPPGVCTIKSDDPRFLVLRDCMILSDFTDEWERAANGRIGLWELADIIIEARKDKLFKDNSSFTFLRTTWMGDLNEDGERCYKGLVGTMWE